MADYETLLTEVYVEVEDLLVTDGPVPPRRPGPPAKLTPGEVITLAVMSQWDWHRSGRRVYRFAETTVRPLFPHLPHRTQFFRQVERVTDTIATIGLALAERVGTAACEVVDRTGVPTRNKNRRGDGHLAGIADSGHSNRVGWYEGVHVLTCVQAPGVLTGIGVAPASTNDRVMAATFFAARHTPQPRLRSVGRHHDRPYLADSGFAGIECEARWWAQYGVHVIATPQPGALRRWDKRTRRAHAGRRQIVETVHFRLLTSFGLERERPHTLAGLLSRLAARLTLNNLCLVLNLRHNRPPLHLTTFWVL